MGLLLKGGLLVDPVDATIQVSDVLVEGQTITEIGPGISASGHTVRDVADLYVLPGLIDVHVHLREPGLTHKETIESGTHAAAAGGFAQVCCMPNTAPITDEPEVVRWIIAEAAKHGYADVHPIAAVTKGSQGQDLTDFSALQKAGAVAISDDGRGVQSAELIRRALVNAGRLGMPIAVHAEDETLAAGGVMHAGEVAAELGLPGISTAAETVMIARDILLAEATGAHVHICHVSPATAVAAIRAGKRRGVRVTAEVAPHHLLLTDQAVRTLGSAAKVNPPLRAERDRRACIEGFLDGTLDIVATDHAPHTDEEKARPIDRAPFGFVGLELSFPLMYTSFVHSGILPLPELVARMSLVPSQVFHLPGGRIRPGAPANITVIDPYTARVVNPRTFQSKGKTTPFAGRSLTGWPILTIHNGRIVHNMM